MDEGSSGLRRLKLRQLDAFLAVAQNGSMAKAAEHLAVSQPAVSKAIADLEQTIGMRLFDRSSRGVEPNVYGQALLKWARAIFDDARQAIKEIKFLADPAAGEVRVAATSAIIAGILPEVLRRIHKQFPRLCIHVIQTTSVVRQFQDLRDRKIDLIIARLPESVGDDINAEVLFQEQTLVMAGVRNPWSRRRKIDLAELIDEPWALPHADTVIGSLVAQSFRLSGLGIPRTAVATISVQLTTSLLVNGPYLAIYPSSMLHFGTDRRLLRVLPVQLPVPPWPVAIMGLKHRMITPAVRVFIKSAHEAAKPLLNGELGRTATHGN